MRRIGKVHNHSLKVHGRVRARGARGQQWFTEARTAQLRKTARTQASWRLHLAGDFHGDLETMPLPPRPHLMRCMLVSNVAVDQRFANGTQGRLLSWSPASVDNMKALSAGHPELSARFAKATTMKNSMSQTTPEQHANATIFFRKESALGRSSMVPEARTPSYLISQAEPRSVSPSSALPSQVHFLDLAVRPETLRIRGEPVLVQLPLVPAYVRAHVKHIASRSRCHVSC